MLVSGQPSAVSHAADVPAASAPPMSHLFVFLERSAEPRAAKKANKGARPRAAYGAADPRQPRLPRQRLRFPRLALPSGCSGARGGSDAHLHLFLHVDGDVALS